MIVGRSPWSLNVVFVLRTQNIPAECVDDVLETLTVLIVVGIVDDVVVVAVRRVVDVLILRHNLDVVHSYSYPHIRIAVPVEVRRLCRIRDVVNSVQTLRF